MKIQVTRSSMPTLEEYTDEIRPIWESCWLTNMGEKHRQLTAALETYLKVSHLSLFSNGHMALELCLQSMELSGEVITTPFTFASTTHAIVRNGLTPVFCDVRESDCTLDAGRLEQLITPRTTAIVPVHVYGNLCEVDAIDAVAKRHGLRVIYDAAHAFGVEKDGRGAGSFGDAAMLSFHATKVFNTIEGGAVCYHNEALGKRLYELKNFGILDEETVDFVGANAKMNEFQAAMGLCNLRHVDGEIAKRKAVVERYRSNLRGVAGMRCLEPQPGVKPNYAYFPVFFQKEQFGASRDEVAAWLAQHEIFARKYFYPITSMFACYQGRFDPAATPVARKLSQEVLTLPLYADLPLQEVDRICGLILDGSYGAWKS